MSKKTLVLGGSVNPSRYSNKAIRKLVDYGHDVVSIGLREGDVSGVKIQTGMPGFKDINTVTVYLSRDNQKRYYDYIAGLKPERIIFNPGTENEELIGIAQQHGIEVVTRCTLIMLDAGVY